MPSNVSSAASPAFQQGFAQLKLQQAKRSAEQAEATARTLAAQAADAQRVAVRAQENARELTVRSDQAQDNAGRARAGLAAIRSLSDTSTRLQQTYERVAERIKEPETAKVGAGETASLASGTAATASAVVTTVTVPGPSVNAQGQTTGKVVNVTA